MSLIISVSGLRGIIGESLTPLVAGRYVAAYASTLETGDSVVVSRDGRTSGPMVKSAVIASLTASGIRVLDAGVAATPTVGVLVREHDAAGGIQITASHNPAPYNGMKLFGSDGRVLDAEAGAVIKTAYENDDSCWVSVERVGDVEPIVDTTGPHLSRVLETVDGELIRSKRFRVLVDSNHGSGGRAARELLTRLGCDVQMLGEDPTGEFWHPPEPTAANLSEVGRHVVDHQCVIGFCQDPDADRLALLDETGRYVGEEFTLAVCVQRMLANPATRGPIVINGATSGVNDRIAEDAGVGCHRSAVGEANVADLMIEVGAVYGGEGSGGPIDPSVGYVRDSLVGMAQVLEHLARRDEPLSTIVDAMPPSVIVKDKIEATPESLPSVFESLRAAFPDASVDAGDGLRLSFDDGRWLLVRGSNTEPIVRFIAEAETASEANALIEAAKQVG